MIDWGRLISVGVGVGIIALILSVATKGRLSQEQPIWLRRLFAGILLAIAALLLLVSGGISLTLWDYVGHQFSAWWTQKPSTWVTYSNWSMSNTAIKGAAAFCGGPLLLWIGVRELRSCRRKPAIRN
jgi:hypothetical protein